MGLRSERLGLAGSAVAFRWFGLVLAAVATAVVFYLQIYIHTMVHILLSVAYRFHSRVSSSNHNIMHTSIVFILRPLSTKFGGFFDTQTAKKSFAFEMKAVLYYYYSYYGRFTFTFLLIHCIVWTTFPYKYYIFVHSLVCLVVFRCSELAKSKRRRERGRMGKLTPTQ